MKVSFQILITFFFFVWCTINLPAQGTSTDTDNPTEDVFEELPYIVLKTSPLSYLYGKQSIEMEYAVSKSVSVETGVGLTFTPVIGESPSYAGLFSEFNPIECPSSNFGDSLNICDESFYDDYSIRKINLGPYFSIAAKYYFINKGLNGPYISFNFKYIVQNYEVLQAEETAIFVRSLDQYAKESLNHTVYSIRLGTQYLFSQFAVDVFCGLGVRNIHGSRLDIGFDPSKNTFMNSFETISTSRVNFELGIRVGLGLYKVERT